MKRGREAAESSSAPESAAQKETAKSSKRRLVSGRDCGMPALEQVIEEIEDVYEDQTILLRFPCFDFFRNVHVCETHVLSPNSRAGNSTRGDRTRDDAHAPSAPSLPAALSTTPTSDVASLSHASENGHFAPEALYVVPGTVETDTPVVVLNRGTTNEMVFEGQWSEVCGDGTAVTNRAILHLDTATAPTSAAAPPSPSSSQVASLLSHVVVGRTADEQRHARAEELKGWVYDRIDVPSAVLVMQRVR